MIETETKIVDFDKQKIEGILQKRARFLSEVLQKRWVFDMRKGKKGYDEFIRVRTDGKEATIAYKFRKGKGLGNTEELEVRTSDFDATAKIFSRLFEDKYYQENRRKTYEYGDTEITLNEWPGIPPVIEVEGKNKEGIAKAIKELGIGGRNLGNVSWEKIYEHYGKNLHSFKILKFGK